MAEVRYRKVKLDEIMDNQGGNSKYSLKYINANPGEYPVYSAKTTGDMNKGYINTYDYDMECLQVTSDGAKAGTIIYREKMKFSVGSATRIWYIKECIENLSLKYIEIKLRSVFFSKEFSWTKKASLYRIKNIEFEIPVDENGNYDIKKQKEIVKKYEIVEEKKQELKEKLDYFKDVHVDFMNTEISKSCSIKIKDIFDLSIGSNGSNFTKTFIKNNSGDIPVYGASKENENPSYGYVTNNARIREKKNGKFQETKVKYFNDCLTYNIDGFAGYIFYRKGKFSISEKVRPLIIKDEHKDYLIPEFLKLILEPIFRNNRKGRLGEDEKNEYTKLYINMIEELEISIPIDKDGKFDIERQKEIVSKYKAVEEIKNSILKKGLPFTLSNIQFDGETPYIYIYIYKNQGLI
ncbi:restriction endonuclease subunit S [Sneathia sanguinegens]|uniref:restriction endonuclease subunit S n=1 Tax=Sneathia sanguinegens TaxID=40543 RepID=UPI00258A75E5|nr:restriction endonuclease subunit S [Sneathia sanguinegens]MDU4652898.1 restriction endonuclease subunit S [Sneathia sanguinegens]